MRIKFLKNATYAQNKKEDCKEYKAGETYEVTDDHGQRWIRRQLAEEVVEPKKPKAEALVPAPPSKA